MRTIYLIFFLSLFSCIEEKKVNEPIVTKNKETKIIIPLNGAKGSIVNFKYGCGYDYQLKDTDIIISSPQNREVNQIQLILSHVGIPMNFEFYSAEIDNAVATMIDNKRYILYDQRLFNYTDIVGQSYWNSMSILAHEIGHHLSGHTLIENSNNSIELEADKFSGFVLFKMGASIQQATKTMSIIGSEYDTNSHPSKYKRINAIEKGWNEANAQRYTSAVPPPPINDESFSEGSYFKDEFFKEELISQNALQAENFGKVINDYNHPILEGIIIDVENSDPSGGARAEYFDEQSSPYNKILTIQLTTVNKSPFDSNRKVGDREKFHLLNYYQMSKADLSWLEEIIVPGRKVRFKSFYFGYGAEDIFYLKKLNRE